MTNQFKLITVLVLLGFFFSSCSKKDFDEKEVINKLITTEKFKSTAESAESY